MPLERILERELIRKCREEGPRFYEPLVRAYEGPALRVATGMLGERAAARDAVQDAFLRAWEGLDGFDADRPFGPWFFRILRNRCRDLDGRRGQRRREVRETVWRALERLADDHREVLVLKELEGFSYREIAGVLDVPEGTVASRLYHARSALREALEEMGVDYP